MATATINTFNGGQAEDYRTFSTNQQTTSANFDILTDPHYLSPYVDLVAETMTSGVVTDFALSDVDAITVSGTTSLVALGQTSSIFSSPAFFRKNSSTDITSAWQYYASGTNTVVKGSLVVYKDNAYCLGDTLSAHNLQKFDGSSTVTTIGTLATTNYASVVPRPFIHPEDNVLYMADGNIIAKYDGSSFTSTAFTLPSNKVVVSLTNYGSYLAIGCRPKNGLGNSTVYLWGRDTTLNTVQQSLDLGPTQLNFCENIGNVLYMVSSLNNVGGYSTTYDNRLIIKGYVGGAVTTIKNFILPSSLGTALNTIHTKRNDKIYFGFSNDTAMYVFGKNKEGDYFMTHDKGFPTGMTTLNGLSLVGDVVFISYNITGTNNLFARTLSLSESRTYTTVSSFTTTINPNMLLEDRYRNKQLDAVGIAFTGSTTTGGVTVKLSVDGGANITLLTNAETGELVREATTDSLGGPFPTGYEFTFTIESTGNAKIKELRYRYTTLDSNFATQNTP